MHIIGDLVPIFIEILMLISTGWFFFYTFIFEAFWWNKDPQTILTYGLRNGNLIIFLISISSIFIFEYMKRRTKLRSILVTIRRINFRGAHANKKAKQFCLIKIEIEKAPRTSNIKYKV